MHTLQKKSQCTCGRVKKIKWKNAKQFKKGLVPVAIGISKCANRACKSEQLHYAGDPHVIETLVENAEFTLNCAARIDEGEA